MPRPDARHEGLLPDPVTDTPDPRHERATPPSAGRAAPLSGQGQPESAPSTPSVPGNPKPRAAWWTLRLALAPIFLFLLIGGAVDSSMIGRPELNALGTIAAYACIQLFAPRNSGIWPEVVGCVVLVLFLPKVLLLVLGVLWAVLLAGYGLWRGARVLSGY
jgi:hypothetical protein